MGISSGRKVTIVSDIHLDPDYTMNMDYARMCHTYEDADVFEYSDKMKEAVSKINHHVQIADKEKLKYGTFGCDSPELLIDTIYEEMKASHGDTDLLMLNGDYVAHGNAVYDGQIPQFEKIKTILEDVFGSIASNFGNIPIVPTIGNNDPVWHNMFPDDLE